MRCIIITLLYTKNSFFIMKNNEYILGVKVNVSRFEDILSKIEVNVRHNKKITIAYLTPHIANYCYEYPDFGVILNQFDIVYADGIGIVIASKLNGGCLQDRITLPDYIDNLCDFLVKSDMSVYLLGARDSVVNNAGRVLKEKHTLLNIVGNHNGFFTMEGNVIEKINKAKPNLLLVGMGLPYQEEWIHRNKDLLNVNVIWACGGMFDIISGRLKRAPDWMLRNNMEWLYRLYREPKRLGKRYLIGNPLFMFRVLKSLFRHA